MIVLWLKLRHRAGRRLWYVHMLAIWSDPSDTHLFLPYEDPFHDVSILR